MDSRRLGIGRRGRESTHPLFWRQTGDGWRYRAMFEEIPLPLDWPVYVSHAEASAYAAWAGKRLPTEAEWQRAAYGSRESAEREFPWGDATPGPQHGYFDFERWDPSPVNAFPAGASAFGVEGLLANGWEWTASSFRAISRLPAVPVLRRLLREFLRWHAFRDEGRLAAHGAKHAAAVLPKLVPAALSSTFMRDSAARMLVQSEREHAEQRDRCATRQASSPPTFETGSPSRARKNCHPNICMTPRLQAVRSDRRTARIRPDARG